MNLYWYWQTAMVSTKATLFTVAIIKNATQVPISLMCICLLNVNLHRLPDLNYWTGMSKRNTTTQYNLVSNQRCQKSQASNQYHDIEEVVGLKRLIWAPSNCQVLCPNLLLHSRGQLSLQSFKYKFHLFLLLSLFLIVQKLWVSHCWISFILCY